MSEDMTLSINGQSRVPPGFRFHPTEEELLHYYLRKKVAYQKIDLDVIRDVDLNKLEPWDIQEKCRIGSAPQNDWYFFSHKDKKYPTGTRTNRATAAGFWKATGRDKIIYSGPKRIGLRKTLVFYKGRAPHGQKSDWIMHEYRLHDSSHDVSTDSDSMEASAPEDGWVVCRVFRKKNYQKSIGNYSPKNSPAPMNSDTTAYLSTNDGVLDQILSYVGRSCKLENESLRSISISAEIGNHSRFLNAKTNMAIPEGLTDRFMHLPRLESPTLSSLPINGSPVDQDSDSSYKSYYQSFDEMLVEAGPNHQCSPKANLSDWVALDRLVASQLNGQEEETSKQLSQLGDHPDMDFGSPADEDLELSHVGSSRSLAYGSSDNDLWSFTKSSSASSSDPLCHLSV